jgi:integrase
VRLSRGTSAELQALRTAETIGEDLVFPMSAVNAWKRVKCAARLVGISEVAVSPHFLRYSHGTHALRRGADLATVRDTLGHASIATTSRYLQLGQRGPAAITSRSDLQTISDVRANGDDVADPDDLPFTPAPRSTAPEQKSPN